MDWINILKNMALIAAVFIPMKLLFALDREQPFLRKGWLTDLQHFLFNAPITAFINVTILAGVVATLSVLVPASVPATLSDWEVWQQLIVIILIADFTYYWAHRWVHRVGPLWCLHKVHHSNEELDVMATFRSHPIDLVLTRGVSVIPPLVLGFDAAAIILYVAIFHWHGLFLHSNTRLRFGWLEHVIATPAWHRWHHADMGDRSCNYAGQLAIFDRIFGSFHLPDHYPESYGIGEPMAQSYPGQLIAPFRSSPADDTQHPIVSKTPQGA